MHSSEYRHVERTARLAYLAPDIVRAILDGCQAKPLNACTLARQGSLPLSWVEQRHARVCCGLILPKDL